MSQKHIALLRGINVGGKNKLPMKDLASVFTDLGCREVQTYIQSGNIVFTAKAAVARRIAAAVAEAIADRFELTVPVVTRTAAELHAVVDGNPFPPAATQALHVAFLAAKPNAKAAAALDRKRSPPDAFALRGRELYLYCPNGMARTKLTNAYFDGKLATTSTMRNWRTVLKLCELTPLSR